MVTRLGVFLAPALCLSLTIDTKHKGVAPEVGDSPTDLDAPSQDNYDPKVIKQFGHKLQLALAGDSKPKKPLKAGSAPERKAASRLVAMDSCHGRGENVTDEEFIRQCKACRVAGSQAPRLYIVEPKDGLGSRLHDVVVGMAVAARNGFALGGVIYGRKNCQQGAATHGVDIFQSSGVVFGVKNARLMFTNHPPDFNAVWPGISKMEGGLRKYGRPAAKDNWLLSAHCISCELDHPGADLSRYFTPKFLEYLQKGSGLMKGPVVFQPGRLSVALHVRRGDVSPRDPLRGTSDTWYYSLVDQLRRAAPDPDIHVFSSMEGTMTSSLFDGYRDRNMTVHLDGDVMDSWSNFAKADVLVMAKSSFSHVPAFFNSKCVIYQPYWHEPLKQWVKSSGNQKEPLRQAQLKELHDCIARLTRERATPP